MSTANLLILSDIHLAGPAEQTRRDHERRAVTNPLLRSATNFYRHFIWLRDPFAHNHLLDQALARHPSADWLIANGDYSLDTAFVGVSDDAALASAQESLGKMRAVYGERFRGTWGDHELGKMSLFGGVGGLRLQSLHRCQNELALPPLWQMDLGRYRLIGVASSLIALPVYEPETLPEERPAWQAARAAHLAEIKAAFDSVEPSQRILLFCHDPSALPFLWQEEWVRRRLPQVEKTILGHLHSPLVFWQSRMLAGMPPIRFLGTSIRRMSEALYQARCWREFNAMLCPSLAGIELRKDGGYYTAALDLSGKTPVRFEFQALPR